MIEALHKFFVKLGCWEQVKGFFYAVAPVIGFFISPLTRVQINRYLSENTHPKLNIGCGRNQIKGWLNTDLKPFSGRVYMDARKRMRFPNGVFEAIYTEHFIEHLSLEAGTKFLEECFRVLKPGGKIRIATPNLKFLMEFYSKDKDDIQKRYKEWLLDRDFPGTPFREDSVIVNHFFHAWGHRFIYDLPMITAVLKKVGFQNIEEFKCGKSKDGWFENMEQHGQIIGEDFNRLETMVVEAAKL